MFKEIETERLLLRKLTLDDAEDLFEYASNEEVAKYVAWSALKDIDQSIKYIKKIIKEYEKGENPYVWAIEHKKDHKMIGTIEMSTFNEKNHWCELDSDMNPNYWNKGLNTEALKGVIHFIFTSLELNKIQAWCYEENIGSSKVLQKAGMRYEGRHRQHFYIDGRYHDMLRYSILKEEYLRFRY